MISRIIASYQEEFYHSRLFNQYFGESRIAVADIETTGLNPLSTAFILGGLISIPDSTSEQYFTEDPAMEPELLTDFLRRLTDFDVIITYNGQSFDLPFLLKRAEHHRLTIPRDLPYNLDLYMILNGHSNLRRFLPDLKQKTIENFLGLFSDRQDEISGRESVELYFSYLRTKNPETREKILLHNRDDIHQLARLLPIIEKVNFQKAMHQMGFPLANAPVNGTGLLIRSVSLGNRELSVSGVQRYQPVEFHSFGTVQAGYRAAFDRNEGDFRLSLPLFRIGEFTVVDAAKYLKELAPLEKYPSLQDGFLILQDDREIRYQELHHFIQLFLKTIGGQIS